MVRVGELRKAKGLTQKQLADLLGLDQATVSNWERGKVMPDSVNQKKLADFFNVSLDYLLGRECLVGLDSSGFDIITYAKYKDVTLKDLIDFIDTISRIKHSHTGAVGHLLVPDEKMINE
jgi:transcriptional regulator with XRE-family HTH domain